MALTLLQLDESPRRAFVRGLAKGIAAPAILFGTNVAEGVEFVPVQVAPFPQVALPPSLSVSDWDRIGMDVKATLSRHEQKNKK